MFDKINEIMIIYIRMKYLALLFLLVVNFDMDAQINKNGFRIYCFSWEYEERFNLSPYTYDESWCNFLNDVNLAEAFLIIDDNDIDEYYWNNQLIKLNGYGSNKLNTIEYLSHIKFIITLNDERYYAGEFIRYESAMVLKHPVIFFDVGKLYKLSGYYIQIRPTNFWGEMDIIKEFNEKNGNVNINRIKEYFKTTGKLK
jgi:hypothetical protein